MLLIKTTTSTTNASPPATTKERNMARTSFLDLPPELRNRIYHLTLIKDTPINIVGALEHTDERTAFALLQASRQLRNEAISIYHADNIFCFSIQDPTLEEHLIKWLTLTARLGLLTKSKPFLLYDTKDGDGKDEIKCAKCKDDLGVVVSLQQRQVRISNDKLCCCLRSRKFYIFRLTIQLTLEAMTVATWEDKNAEMEEFVDRIRYAMGLFR